MAELGRRKGKGPGRHPRRLGPGQGWDSQSQAAPAPRRLGVFSGSDRSLNAGFGVALLERGVARAVGAGELEVRANFPLPSVVTGSLPPRAIRYTSLAFEPSVIA